MQTQHLGKGHVTACYVCAMLMQKPPLMCAFAAQCLPVLVLLTIIDRCIREEDGDSEGGMTSAQYLSRLCDGQH